MDANVKVIQGYGLHLAKVDIHRCKPIVLYVSPHDHQVHEENPDAADAQNQILPLFLVGQEEHSTCEGGQYHEAIEYVHTS